MINTKSHPFAKTLKIHRRELHMIPELDRDLPKTRQYILSVLKWLDCDITFLCGSGICAFFDKGMDETYAFRTDMDALPMTEANTCSYRSTHENMMHACGHDGHMAMALALGEYVDTTEDLNCNVLLIFQPAEETLGGAKEICESGILEKHNVRRIFGIHLWPYLKAGKLASRAGAIMPKSAEIDITIHGKTAHGITPYKGCDALYIAAEYITRVYSRHEEMTGAVPHFPNGITDILASTPGSPDNKTLIHIGKMTSGHARNVVSDYAELFGTIRTFNEKNFDRIISLLSESLEEVMKEYDCHAEFSHSEGYPPVINDADLMSKILPVLDRLPGGYEDLKETLMISDDFSFYGQYAPAVYFLLGTGTDIPLHSVNFDFDETILISGFELYRILLTC